MHGAAGLQQWGLADHLTLHSLRQIFNGTFIAAGGYTRESGSKAVASDHADLICYGRSVLLEAVAVAFTAWCVACLPGRSLALLRPAKVAAAPAFAAAVRPGCGSPTPISQSAS